jgi:hypothetical protein
LALGLAFQFAQRLVVLEDGNVAQSLSTGFRMIRWHFKEVALGWLVLMAVSIGVGIAVAILAIAVAIPGVALGVGGWAVGGMTGAIVAGSFAAVFFVGILLVATGATSAYSSVYWTLLFRSVRSLPAPAARGAIIGQPDPPFETDLGSLGPKLPGMDGNDDATVVVASAGPV